MWNKYDKKGTGSIPADDMVDFLRKHQILNEAEKCYYKHCASTVITGYYKNVLQWIKKY